VATKVRAKGERDLSSSLLDAVGLEAEFSLFIDDRPQKPEAVFGSPRSFIRGPLLHRLGTSFQLATGAAIYFDTGVIELATPPIEIDQGCMARAVRLLWESIRFIREELDAWEQRTGRAARLAGFSAHYNVSVDWASHDARRLDSLAKLLTYVLPPPMMLLATNRLSNGIGVRPRPSRIEVTVDFTPSIPMMIAAGSLLTGIVREVATWDSFDVRSLDKRGIPRIRGFKPMPHTSRKGWLARFDCFPLNPMANDPDESLWQLAGRRGRGRSDRVSLRAAAMETFDRFRRTIADVADPSSLQHIDAVLSGREPSYLDLDERPAEYEDVGGGRCTWPGAYSQRFLDRSRFERIVLHTMARDKLRIAGELYTPTGMQGWSHIAFSRDSDGRRMSMSLVDLVDYLSDWR
jgi:hypothetical protein